MAFAAFADAPVDVAVVEVGHGRHLGRHQRRRRAGRRGHPGRARPRALPRHDDRARSPARRPGSSSPASYGVLAQQPVEAAEVLLRRVGRGRRHRRPRGHGVRRRCARSSPSAASCSTLRGPGRRVRRDVPPLHGAHQAHNAACALAAVEALPRRRARRARAARHRPGPGGVRRRRPRPGGWRWSGAAPDRGRRRRAQPGRCQAPRPTAVGEAFGFSRWSAWSAAMADKDVARHARGARAGAGRGRRHPDRLVAAAMPADELAALAVEVFGADRVDGRAAPGRRARRRRSRWPRRTRRTSAAPACWSPARSSPSARPATLLVARDADACRATDSMRAICAERAGLRGARDRARDPGGDRPRRRRPRSRCGRSAAAGASLCVRRWPGCCAAGGRTSPGWVLQVAADRDRLRRTGDVLPRPGRSPRSGSLALVPRAARGRAAAQADAGQARRRPSLRRVSVPTDDASAPWSWSSPTASAAAWSARCSARFERKGLAIVALELRTHRRRHWPTALRRARRARPFYPPLREFITSRPAGRRWCSRATEAIEVVRALNGATDAGQGAAGHDPRRPVAVEPREPRPRLGLARVGRARDRAVLPRPLSRPDASRAVSVGTARGADTMTSSVSR